MKRFFKKSETTGIIIFAPMNVLPEYQIDYETQTVIGTVNYEGKTYLTVKIDVANRKTKVEGSLRSIKEVVHPFTKKNYIELIQGEAYCIFNPKTRSSK